MASSSDSNSASSSPSRVKLSGKVDHTYTDLSRYLQEGRKVSKPKKAGRNFPAKLHRMVSEPRFSHIITWMVRGLQYHSACPYLLHAVSYITLS